MMWERVRLTGNGGQAPRPGEHGHGQGRGTRAQRGGEEGPGGGGGGGRAPPGRSPAGPPPARNKLTGSGKDFPGREGSLCPAPSAAAAAAAASAALPLPPTAPGSAPAVCAPLRSALLRARRPRLRLEPAGSGLGISRSH